MTDSGGDVPATAGRRCKRLIKSSKQGLLAAGRWTKRSAPLLLGLTSSFVILAVGLYAQFYPTQILAGGWFNALFWVGLAIGVLAQVGFTALAERSAKANEDKLTGLEAGLKEQVTQLSRLPTIVRTQPPETFLVQYGQAIEANLLVAMRVLQDFDGDEGPPLAVRNTLQWLASLAALFDASNGAERGRFTANLMVFVPSHDLGPWSSKIKFADGLDRSRYSGALVLRREFAVDQDGKNAAPPEEFALLVPRTPQTEMPATASDAGKLLWTALPGAPLACARRGFELVNEPKQMGEWIRTHTDFRPSIAADVENYFRTIHTSVAGFLSLPVVVPSTNPDEPGQVVGVANIDWTEARLLPLAEGAATFHRQVQPLLSLLALLIERTGLSLAGSPNVEVGERA